MNIKLIGLVICAGYGIWFTTIGGRQVSPEHVQALYQEYVSAFDRGDGKAVCEIFDEKFHGKFSSTSRRIPVRESVDKASACTSVDDFYRTKSQLETAVGHELYTNIEYTINSITIAPDKKSASVDLLMQMRIGTEQGPLLDMRSTQTDIVVRRFGKARFAQSDGSVSFFK